MEESDFEGTEVLEKLALIGVVEEFFDAVDADDFAEAKSLMIRAGIDQGRIAIVLKKMRDADGEH